MSTVTSRDGTTIGYERLGNGSPIILVDGALCYRGMGPMRALARQLANHFTLVLYDRRGRGESGDTPPWSVDRRSTTSRPWSPPSAGRPASSGSPPARCSRSMRRHAAW